MAILVRLSKHSKRKDSKTNDTQVSCLPIVRASMSLDITSSSKTQLELESEESVVLTKTSAHRICDILEKVSKRTKAKYESMMCEDDKDVYTDVSVNGMKLSLDVVLQKQDAIRNDSNSITEFTISIYQSKKNKDRDPSTKNFYIKIQKESDSTDNYSIILTCDPTFATNYNSLFVSNVNTDSYEYIGDLLRVPFLMLEKLLKSEDPKFEFEFPIDSKTEVIRRELLKIDNFNKKQGKFTGRLTDKQIAEAEVSNEWFKQRDGNKKFDPFIKVSSITFQDILCAFPEDLNSTLCKSDYHIANPIDRIHQMQTYMNFLYSIYCWTSVRNSSWNNSPRFACDIEVGAYPKLEKYSCDSSHKMTIEEFTKFLNSVNSSISNLKTSRIVFHKYEGTNKLYSLELRIPKAGDLMSPGELIHQVPRDSRYKLKAVLSTCFICRITVHNRIFSNKKIYNLSDLLSFFNARAKHIDNESEHPVLSFVDEILDSVLSSLHLNYWLSNSWVWSLDRVSAMQKCKDNTRFKAPLTNVEQKILIKYFSTRKPIEEHSVNYLFYLCECISAEDLSLLKRPISTVKEPNRKQRHEYLSTKIQKFIESINWKTGLLIKFDSLYHVYTYSSMAESVGTPETIEMIKGLFTERDSIKMSKIHKKVKDIKRSIQDIFPGGINENRVTLVVEKKDTAPLLSTAGYINEINRKSMAVLNMNTGQKRK